jgi:hypothetical protein
MGVGDGSKLRRSFVKLELADEVLSEQDFVLYPESRDRVQIQSLNVQENMGSRWILWMSSML